MHDFKFIIPLICNFLSKLVNLHLSGNKLVDGKTEMEIIASSDRMPHVTKNEQKPIGVGAGVEEFCLRLGDS